MIHYHKTIENIHCDSMLDYCIIQCNRRVSKECHKLLKSDIFVHNDLV